MPFEVIVGQIESELGKPVSELFEYLQETPYAAASIGQVHRAVWSDGREVAVKVQYPGADEALRSDLRQLRRLAPLLRPLNPGTDIRGIIDELYDSTVSELDYRTEADITGPLGFDGKQAIHPAQLDAIHAAYSPSKEGMYKLLTQTWTWLARCWTPTGKARGRAGAPWASRTMARRS